MSNSSIIYPQAHSSQARVKEHRLILIFVGLGILLSAWRISIVEVVNQDGAAYLMAAAGDWSLVDSFKNWNFYPLLLSWISGFLHVQAETVAYACNILFDAVTLVFFLRVVLLVGGDRRALLWAGIAFLSLTYFNDNRAEIIRDHGYWAAYMVGVWFFLRLYKEFRWVNAVGWTGAIFIATLFRIEGIAFLALAPLAALKNTGLLWPQRALTVFKIWLPSVLILVAFALTFGSFGVLDERLLELVGNGGQLFKQVTQGVPSKAEILREHVFPYHSSNDAVQGIYAILAWGIISDIVKGLSPLFVLILLYRRWFPRQDLSAVGVRVMWAFVLINIFILISWMLIHYIMVARYAQGMVFILLVWVAFALAELHRKQFSGLSQGIGRKGLLVGAIIAIMFVDNIVETGSKKTYVVDAGGWIKDNISQNARIGSVHEAPRLRYYANKGLVKQPTFAVEEVSVFDYGKLDYIFLKMHEGVLVGTEGVTALKRDMRYIQEIVDGSGSGYAVYGR